MKNFVTLGALVISLALIIYLYVRLSATERQLTDAQRRMADCEQVTFQLQNQLSQQARMQAREAGQPVPGEQE
ncbi:hypothetical protein [Solirubrum puertoriconensis]|uniref:Uncharacterized protein n=1 Tax=Solirubrum puertoriconensis TaxID=1751427 RepID=A0A9X0L4H7_SOLP1|nr:hypothetical protein [Solirubrum puertoriconensis]KUG07614.1 hypothetical protein ASU33_14880 [Solirubrum puertoriconensis]